jgi:flavin reductase (DIM6/NTAB) family NADH-FMN oxidoreductase RutF
VNDIAAIFADPHVAARGMIATIPHPEPDKRPWRVAANPLRFAGTLAPLPVAPPSLGADQALASVVPAQSGIDPKALRQAFGTFATGVTVITTREANGTPRGFTANSFTSVSLDPPLLLVCLAKSAHSCEVFATARHFAVNVLAQDQKSVSGLFSSRAPDKFQQCDWRAGHANLPLLNGTLSQFCCRRHRLVDAGDHLVLIGQVEDFSHGAGQPLGYFKGSYFSIGLEGDLVEAALSAKGGRIGAVLATSDGVLLKTDAAGQLSLPKAPGPTPSLDALKASLVALGLQPAIDFVYAAFERLAAMRSITTGVSRDRPQPVSGSFLWVIWPSQIWQMPPRPKCSPGSLKISGMGSSASITAMKPQGRSGRSRAPMLKTEGKSDVASRTSQGRHL